MKKKRTTSKGKGWYFHPNEHALASKGISTKYNSNIHNDVENVGDNHRITFHPSSRRYHWVVTRDSGAVYDEGWADSPIEAEILVNHHLEDMLEEEIPKAKGYKLTDEAPYKNITEFMKTYDLSRDEANRFIQKWHPYWIDYEHPMSQEELEEQRSEYKLLSERGERL